MEKREQRVKQSIKTPTDLTTDFDHIIFTCSFTRLYRRESSSTGYIITRDIYNVYSMAKRLRQDKVEEENAIRKKGGKGRVRWDGC